MQTGKPVVSRPDLALFIDRPNHFETAGIRETFGRFLTDFMKPVAMEASRNVRSPFDSQWNREIDEREREDMINREVTHEMAGPTGRPANEEEEKISAHPATSSPVFKEKLAVAMKVDTCGQFATPVCAAFNKLTAGRRIEWATSTNESHCYCHITHRCKIT
jgi:hypothetical protein